MFTLLSNPVMAALVNSLTQEFKNKCSPWPWSKDGNAQRDHWWPQTEMWTGNQVIFLDLMFLKKVFVKIISIYKICTIVYKAMNTYSQLEIFLTIYITRRKSPSYNEPINYGLTMVFYFYTGTPVFYQTSYSPLLTAWNQCRRSVY